MVTLSLSYLVDENVFEVSRLLQFEFPGGAIDWLQRNGLLAKNRLCPKYSSIINQRNKLNLHDGKVWGCPEKVKLILLYY